MAKTAVVALPSGFHAIRCIVLAEWHRNVPVRIEWIQFHQSILRPAGHISQYFIHDFLENRVSG